MYPNVSVSNTAHSQGVERKWPVRYTMDVNAKAWFMQSLESGNMIIMSYAQVLFSGDPGLVRNYVSQSMLTLLSSNLLIFFSMIFLALGRTTSQKTLFQLEASKCYISGLLRYVFSFF